MKQYKIVQTDEKKRLVNQSDRMMKIMSLLRQIETFFPCANYKF